MNMREITATFEIVTPMFLGDGDQQARIIRPQSFKAELLFWWRAMHYAGYVGEAATQAAALAAMHRDEAFLFGGVEPGVGENGKGKPRQAAFLLKIEHAVLQRVEVGAKLSNTEGGLVYLGYGLMNYRGLLSRSCIEAGASFRVLVHFRPSGPDEDKVRMRRLEKELANAIKIFGLLGGLGSRKRRGFGSVRMKSLTVFGKDETVAPQTPDLFGKMVRKLVMEGAAAKSQDSRGFPISAFGADSQIRLTERGQSDALACQNTAGEAFRLYRAWGQGGVITQNPLLNSLKNFQSDHDWFKHEKKYPSAAKSMSAEWALRARNQLPERANFGLPHNYFKKDWGKLSVELKGEKTSRRASPLFFHITKLGDKFHCVLTFFDTQFMPDPRLKLTDTTNGDHAIANTGGGKTDVFEPDASVIIGFLDGKLRTGGSHTYLATTPILPEPEVLP
jgi:CRISPR-associated protein Cmr1